MSDPSNQAPTRLPLDLQRQLFVSWLLRYASEAGFTGHYGSGGSISTVGNPQGRHVTLEWLDSEPWVTVTASEPSDHELVAKWHRTAAAAVDRSDMGGYVWYSTSVLTEEPDTHGFMEQLMRLLGDQTRIVGWRRLGGNVLLEFIEGSTGMGEGLIAPATTVAIHVATPGPIAGPFSSIVAATIADVVAAVCSFALGRHAKSPLAIFPANDGVAKELDERRTDPAIGTLARKGVSLDLFDDLTSRAGEQGHAKARAAFLTFDAALQQEREQVATLLFVACAECLTNPMQPWKTERLTKRFVSFFDEAIPEDIDQIVQHSNFEGAFNIRRGARSPHALRREFLSQLYALRSAPVHEGLESTYRGFFDDLGSQSAIRRALASDFAQAALLGYLKSPSSSLVGHPAFTESVPA